jgi:hypothetical protein
VRLSQIALACCAALLVAGCGSAQEELSSDAEQALSVVKESALLAREGSIGRLTPPFQTAHADDLAQQAEDAAKALDQDAGHDADRHRLADDVRKVARLLHEIDDERPNRKDFEAIAQDAEDAASNLGAT